MKLEGTLDTFPLRELIDMVIYSSVTGVLEIEAPGAAGRLFFRDSDLYHAECGPARGVEALGELFELSSGNFSFTSKVVSDEVSLAGSVDIHLEHAEQLSTRWRQIRRYVPSLDLFPLLMVSREIAMRRISPHYYDLLDGIDGCTSLRQLAERCGWAGIDMAEAAAQMSLDGVIDLRREPVSSPPGPPPELAVRGEGLFDRIRGRAGQLQQGAPEPGQPSDDQAPSRTVSEDVILQFLRSSS